jgi:hypothetical protein
LATSFGSDLREVGRINLQSIVHRMENKCIKFNATVSRNFNVSNVRINVIVDEDQSRVMLVAFFNRES